MTKVRDIIEATNTPPSSVVAWYTRDELPIQWPHRDKVFVTTFDPEHVALMENVIEAYRDADCPRPANCADCLMAKPCAMFNALETHRRKHGLV
jgi:hypothetical protein